MNVIHFTVNGESYSLTESEVPIDTSLNDYLRNHLNLFGTKAMCHEGGCGSCIVTVARKHPVAKEKQIISVNSCLVDILSCHQWDITTVEGVGSRKDGYHPVQSLLASNNGTQCGYCTPGWVMSMYSLLEGKDKAKLSSKEIENSFAGNLCRCTGYRPILDAFKHFAADADDALKDKLEDLEDLHKLKCLKKCKRNSCFLDDEWCVVENEDKLLTINGQCTKWYKAFCVKEVFEILCKEGVNSYRLIAGNTGKGVYPITNEDRVLIDISSISALKETCVDANLVLGAGMSLNEVMAEMKTLASKNEDFAYLNTFYKHLDLVAHVPVRNIGTIGGNLAIKNKHPEFPSDVFLLLDTVGATVTIVNSCLENAEIGMKEYMKTDLKDKLILNVKLPPLASTNRIITYKIMPRAQNAHAIVNAGFRFKLDSSNHVLDSTVTFGTISSKFTRAADTEQLLKGLDLYKDDTLQKCLRKLTDEITPEEMPPESSPACRKALALGLFYKAVLSLSPDVNPRYKSGGSILERGVSSGTQVFDTDKTLWPLNQPVPKIEALTQCSGEVSYSCDVKNGPRDVHVAFVLSTICIGDIEKIDPTEALKMPGVVAVLTAKDIPGKNSFTPTDVPWQESDEEILASKRVSFYGQPVALVAASTHRLAVKAADLVKVTYKKDARAPVLTIQDALVAPDKDKRIRNEASIKPTDRGTGTTHVLKGKFAANGQYHFSMETQCCSATPAAGGVSLRSATQWMDLVHVAVAQALDLLENQVDVTVPRVGGAYGGKASRSSQIACACALVAYKLNRAASLVMPLTDNMAAIGKRQECHAEYEVGVDDEGVIQYLNLTCYSDVGYSFNDSAAGDIPSTLQNLYETSRWKIDSNSVLTDKASNTWCRGPSTTEATAIQEHIMERIAHITKKDPLEVKQANIASKNDSIKELIAQIKAEFKYDESKAAIEKFNAENAWKKKGLKCTIMSYPIGYSGNFPVTISVYHADGTIAISHGGIEMGQGINTKVAQVCAYKLKVPLDKVTVKASDNIISPNSMASNGSITSDSVAFATIKACDQLLARLQDVRTKMNDPTWEEVVKKAYDTGINLQTSYMTSPLDSLEGYSVYGACCTEVILDVLTGQHVITRLHVLEDTGVSMSPVIDVGQIEGAFVMGLGMWTTEHLVYDKSGKLLTDRTWNYKPPGVKDIPVDFTVSFKRNSVNKAGVLRSKTTGEPALVLAVAVPFAIHDAILEARKEFGYQDTEWVHVDTPYTIENILKGISPKIESYKLK